MSAPAQPTNERKPLLNGSSQGSQGRSTSYGATAGPSSAPRRRPSKKPQPSAAKIEAKVWFANERTWIAWLRASLLIGSFALAMLNSASFFEHRGPDGSGSSDFPGEPGIELPPSPFNPSDGSVISTFGTVYVLISIGTLLWGLANYHRRVSLIKRKYPGPLDDLIGPPLICAVIFVAILINFLYKVKEYRSTRGHAN